MPTSSISGVTNVSMACSGSRNSFVALGAGTMPSALVRLLQTVFSEEWGLNLRNRVAHGLATEADCSQANLDKVLHNALLLAGIRLVEQDDGSEGGETGGGSAAGVK